MNRTQADNKLLLLNEMNANLLQQNVIYLRMPIIFTTLHEVIEKFN